MVVGAEGVSGGLRTLKGLAVPEPRASVREEDSGILVDESLEFPDDFVWTQ